MAEISYEPNFALSSTLDLVSKLDKEKYNWTLKCVDGDIKLEILDRNKLQSPTPKPEANHGNSRTQPSFPAVLLKVKGQVRAAVICPGDSGPRIWSLKSGPRI